MKENGLELVEDGDKYYMLVPLYNKWHMKTCFLSVGNTNVPEWDEMVEYCKNNKIETLHFFFDLIECFEDSHKHGTRADNFVGFFLDVLDECYPNEFASLKEIGYIDGQYYQRLWTKRAKKLLKDWENKKEIE